MTVKVLKPFEYSRDGINLKPAAVGDEPGDIPVQYLDGLEAAGFISRGKTKPAVSSPENKMQPGAPENKGGTAESREKQRAVAISEGWQSLGWPELRSLASQVCNDAIKGKAQAIAAIEAEIALRATEDAAAAASTDAA